MTRYHVGKTDNQCERLGKDSNELNRNQNELHKEGYRRIEDMRPEMPVGAEHDHKETDDTQYHSECNITGYVGRSRNQTNQVINKDEEKNSQHVWHYTFRIEH